MAQQTMQLFSFGAGAVTFDMLYDDVTNDAISLTYTNTTTQNAGVSITSNVTGRNLSRTLQPGTRTANAPANLDMSDIVVQAWWPA